MKKQLAFIHLLLSLIFTGGQCEHAGQTLTSKRGIPPQLLGKYTAGGDRFHCFDGSATIAITAVNDDYCDCKDGSDEPGTSACTNGRFYCKNKGHLPAEIPSSRVNDGICDVECCDGTDEWLGLADCPNVCYQAAAEYKRKKEEADRQQVEGLKVKQDLINFAQESAKTRERELADLKLTIQAKEKTLAGLKSQKSEADKLVSKASAEQRLRNQRNCYGRLASTKLSLGKLKQTIDNVNEQLDNLRHVVELDAQSEKTAAEYKLAIQQFLTMIDTLHLDEYKTLPLLEDNSIDENDAPQEYSDSAEEHSETTHNDNAASASWSEYFGAYYERCISPLLDSMKPWGLLRDDDSVEPAVIPVTPTELSMAQQRVDKLQRLIDDMDREISGFNNRINDIETKGKRDYGPQGEFTKLDGQCFESAAGGEYTYEICPFGSAKQKNGQTGALVASLGNWESWNADDKYLVMRFVNGDQCWNGPRRSMRVNLKCGAEHKVKNVWEPSKCEYEMDMESPVVC